MSRNVGAEEREVPLITRMLMQSCRFLHYPQTSNWRCTPQNHKHWRKPRDQIEHAINDIPSATIQAVCRSVRCRCWECTEAEGGYFEHVRA